MRITWTDVAGRLTLDERQTITGKDLLDRGKDAVLELWSSEADAGQPAPIEFVAALSSRTSISHNPAAWGRLIEYLSTTKKKGAASTYLQLQCETEWSIKDELSKLFDTGQFAAFEQLQIGSLLIDVDTGYTPIDDRISQLLDRRRER